MQVLPHILTPETEYSIAQRDERFVIFFIALDIPFDLGHPETPVTLYAPFGLLPLVSAPEFAVNKNGEPVFPDNNIRSAGKFLSVRTVPDTFCPQRLTQQQLRFGILRPDAAHV